MRLSNTTKHKLLAFFMHQQLVCLLKLSLFCCCCIATVLFVQLSFIKCFLKEKKHKTLNAYIIFNYNLCTIKNKECVWERARALTGAHKHTRIKNILTSDLTAQLFLLSCFFFRYLFFIFCCCVAWH